jgi:5-methylcytosine-specific restriction endonuclease McrA
MCGQPRPRGHHIIPKQVLRRTCLTKGLDAEAVVWDQRNLLGLCDRCHTRHHSRMSPVPLPTVLAHAPGVVAFATELGLTWYLSRNHPSRTRRRA